MIRAVFYVLPFLVSCAAYQAAEERAWRKDGACVVVCDYRTGYLSAARRIDAFQCRCMTPELAEINRNHHLPLVDAAGTIFCPLGCRVEAEEILQRQPWRRPKGAHGYLPLGDP